MIVKKGSGEPRSSPLLSGVGRIMSFIIILFVFFTGLPVMLNASSLPSAEAQESGLPDGLSFYLTKTYDGTGHGTENQTFINSQNGYLVGDNTPSDGVLATKDFVGFRFSMSFSPGPERSFTINKLDSSPLLLLTDDNICVDGPGYTASGSVHTGCTITIRDGANGSFTVDSALWAQSDFQSEVSDPQIFGLRIGDRSYTIDPVRIVQSPRVDMELRVQSVSDGLSTDGGVITLSPYMSAVPGYSPTKGLVETAHWSADLNVENMPEGTTYFLDGVELHPVNGWIRNMSHNGEASIRYYVPNTDLPSGEDSYFEDVPIYVNVLDGSFSHGEALNFGTGVEPGSFQDSQYSTENPQQGTRSGVDYPNNNWANARIVYYHQDQFLKTVYAPRNNNSIFDDESRFFQESFTWESSRTVSHDTQHTSQGYQEGVSAGTELVTVITAKMDEPDAWDNYPSQVAVCDLWNPAEKIFDSSRIDEMKMTWDGVNVPYTVYYTDDVTKIGQGSPSCGDYTDSSWSTEKPEDNNIVGVAVVGDRPAGTSEWSNAFIHIPQVLHGGYPSTVHNGDQFMNFFAAVTDGSKFSAGDSRRITYREKTPPNPRIYKDIAHRVNEHQTVKPGERYSYVLYPYAEVSAPDDEVFTRIVDQMDNKWWGYEVSPQTAEYYDYVINEEAGTIIFTLKDQNTLGYGRVMGLPGDTNNYRTFPRIEYSAQLSLLTPTQSYDTTTNIATHSLIGEPHTENSYDLTMPIVTATNMVSEKRKDLDVVEVGDGVGWTLNMTNNGDRTGNSYYLDILPWFGSPYSVDGRVTTYEGRVTPTDIRVIEQDSAPGTVLYYTNREPSTLPTTTLGNLSGNNVTGYSPNTAHGWTTDVSSLGGIGRVTAIMIYIPGFGEPGAIASSVKIDADLPGSKVDDLVVNQLGEGVSDSLDLVLPDPVPVLTRVVDSSISGTVWWDEDRGADLGADEERMEGIRVVLTRHDIPIEETWVTHTNSDGYYRFDGLHSGHYTVSVTRADGSTESVPLTYLNQYDRDLDVEQTYSWFNKRYGQSTSVTDVNLLPDQDIINVNFGYHISQSEAKLDKEVIGVTPIGDGVNEITYDITVQNTGESFLNNGVIHDVLSDDQRLSVNDVTNNTLLDSGEQVMTRMVSETPVTQVALGSNHSIILLGNGKVLSSGSNSSGQLGDGSTTNSSSPLEVNLPSAATMVAAGGNHSVVLLEDGSVWTFGDNSKGQLGDGSLVSKSTPVRIDTSSFFGTPIAVDASLNNTVILTDSGHIYMMGDNYSGQTGSYLDSGEPGYRSSPQLVNSDFGGEKPVMVSLGDWHVVVLTEAGGVWSWGANGSGQLGRGGLDSSTPMKLDAGTMNNEIPVSVHAGDEQTFIVMSDGGMWSAGGNWGGQLATGSYDPPQAFTPQRVSRTYGDRVPASLDIGKYASTAVMSDGTAWRWGYVWNPNEEQDEYHTSLTRIPNIQNADSVSTGHNGSRIFVNRSQPYVMGDNSQGQLAVDGGYLSDVTPVDLGEHVAPAISSTTIVTPSNMEAFNGQVKVEWGMGVIAPGESVKITLKTYVMDRNHEQFLTNQAYYRSDETPLNEPDPTPPSPYTSKAEHDSMPWGIQIPGSQCHKIGDTTRTTCDPNITIMDDDDRVDQVPVYIPGGSNIPEYITIGDRVWFDENSNGIQDANETTGIPGVGVTVWNSDRTRLISQTTSDDNGYWSITLVKPLDDNVEYIVEFNTNQVTLPGEDEALIVTESLVGNDRSVDSNGPRTVISSQVDDDTIDIGFTREPSGALDISKVAVQDTVQIRPDGSAEINYVIRITNSGNSDIPLGDVFDYPAIPEGGVITSVTIDGVESSPANDGYRVAPADTMVGAEGLVIPVQVNISYNVESLHDGSVNTDNFVCQAGNDSPGGHRSGTGVFNLVTHNWDTTVHDPSGEEDNEDCVTIIYDPSSINVVKLINDHDANSVVDSVLLGPGENTMTITVVVTNDGSTTLDNVTVTDTIVNGEGNHEEISLAIDEALMTAQFTNTSSGVTQVNGSVTLLPGESVETVLLNIPSPSTGVSHHDIATARGTIRDSGDDTNPAGYQVVADDPAHAYRLTVGLPLPETGMRTLVMFGLIIIVITASSVIILRRGGIS